MSKKGSIIDRMIEAAISVLFLIVLAILSMISVFWYAAFYIMPQAELPRANDGTFMVNTENYRQFHTYSRIFHSTSGSAELTEKLVLRSIPSAVKTCDGIRNCENYESTFYKIDYSTPKSMVIKQSDDAKVSEYVKSLKDAVARHNQSIQSFNSKVELDLPDKPDIFNFVFNQYESGTKSAANTKHNSALSYAQRSCRNNGQGCNVKLTVSYSYFGFPNVAAQVRR